MTDFELPIADDAPERMSRRRLLALGAITGGGLVATALAACSPAASTTGWTSGPVLSSAPAAAVRTVSAVPSAVPSAARAGSHDPSHVPAASSAPAGDHDGHAKSAVDRFLGGENASLTGKGNQPLAPTLKGDTKVFELTVDPIKHEIDAQSAPVDALGFNGTCRVRGST